MSLSCGRHLVYWRLWMEKASAKLPTTQRVTQRHPKSLIAVEHAKVVVISEVEAAFIDPPFHKIMRVNKVEIVVVNGVHVDHVLVHNARGIYKVGHMGNASCGVRCSKTREKKFFVIMSNINVVGYFRLQKRITNFVEILVNIKEKRIKLIVSRTVDSACQSILKRVIIIDLLSNKNRRK